MTQIAKTISERTWQQDPEQGSVAAALPIPFHQASMTQAEEQEIIETLRSGWLTTGSKTRLFEQQFAEYVGAKHAVGLNSCTAALHLSLLTQNIGPGDEVVTTPITFAATVNVIEHVGARPVFVDVEPETLNMDVRQLESVITPKTKAIMPVHFAGHPCDLDPIHIIAAHRGLTVIEDAAHAIESSYRGRKIGHLSDTTCFSFYATKNITTGEGGMLTTNDETLAEQARMLSLHGISVDAWKRYRPGEYKHWDILSAGFKYNMFDLQACLGIHQLQRIETMWEARKQLTETYDEAFADMPAIQPLKQHDDVRSAYHLYAIQLNTAATSLSRDDLLMQLQERQIGVGVHFRPVHLHPYYRGKYGYAEGTFPVAEKAGDQLLSLPLFPSMTEQAQQYVIRTVKDILQHS